MKAITVAALCLLATLCVTLDSSGEATAQSRVYFARAVYDPHLFLLGSFKPRLNVTLMNGKKICKAKTGSAFSFEHVGDLVKATKVVGIADCPKGFAIAVVGPGAESVQLHAPEEIQSLLPEGVESKARQLVGPMTQDPESSYRFASPHPRAFKVGRFILLKFEWEGIKGKGPFVLFLDDKAFQFEADCTNQHVLFSVNRKLYLAFHEGGCFNGRDSLNVYDLSGAAPKRVYCGDLGN